MNGLCSIFLIVAVALTLGLPMPKLAKACSAEEKPEMSMPCETGGCCGEKPSADGVSIPDASALEVAAASGTCGCMKSGATPVVAAFDRAPGPSPKAAPAAFNTVSVPACKAAGHGFKIENLAAFESPPVYILSSNFRC